MFKYRDEVLINAPPKKVFYFLSHIDVLYRQWHRKDHVFCKTLRGDLHREGCIFHFLEKIGKFPLYLIAQIVKIKENNYVEYLPIFPISLFKLGYAYFRIEPVNKDRSRLIAFVQVGSEITLFDKVLDFLVVRVVGVNNIRKHIREEGINVKNYLE